MEFHNNDNNNNNNKKKYRKEYNTSGSLISTHDIAEILLKLALTPINQSLIFTFIFFH